MSDTHVVVALVGDPENAGELPEGETWTGQPYNERPQVALQVMDEDTLGEVMDRAIRHFGARYPEGYDFHAGFIAFYKFPGYDWPQLRTELDLVDADGRVRWNTPWQWATIAELREAAEAGLISGDPSRWYLVLIGPMGDGVPVEWSDIVAAWFLFEKLLGWVSDTHGTSEAISKVVNRIRRRHLKDLPEVLDRHAADWVERGAAPPDLSRLLSMDRWDAPRLSSLLGCPMEDTEAILWSHGYVYDLAEGVWLKASTPEAALLEHIARVVDHFDLPLPEHKERLQARLLAVLRSYTSRLIDLDDSSPGV